MNADHDRTETGLVNPARPPEPQPPLLPLKSFVGEKPPAPAWFAEALAVEPQHRHVNVDGVRIHYLQWGDAARRGLLLVHGNAAHAMWWSFIAPYLARNYNVAAIDLSGMGDSGWRETYTMHGFAAEELAVMNDAGMFSVRKAPIVVAHSFGGYITILAGALYGRYLGGTVIVDAPVVPPGGRGPQAQPHKPHRVYPTMAAALARYRLVPAQKCDNLFLLDHVARHSLKAVEGGFSWKFDPRIWRDFSIGDMSARLKATQCRIAILRGEHSALMPADVGRYMFELLGRAAPVVEIPDAGHHIMLDQPLALVAAVRALLADWEHSVSRRKI